MNDLKELFAATADGAPEPRALVARAHALAERRRAGRHQRTIWTVGATAAMVAVTVTAAVALRPRAEPVYVALGADGIARVGESAEDCNGFSKRVPGTELPPGVRLVSDDPDLTQARPAFARRMTSDCSSAAVPLALADVDAHGRTRRALMLSGPLPAPVQATGDARRPVRVRGVAADLLVPQGNVSGVTWRDSDGRAWVLRVTGLTEDQTIAYADALDLPADGSASLPAALTRGYRDLGTIPERRGLTQHVWYLSYRNAAGHEIEVEGSEHHGPVATFLIGVPADLSREVTVNGTRAVWFTNGPTFGAGLQLLQWEVSPGVQASVSGVGLTLDELMELATSVHAAADDDPAVTTSE
ncbi:MAG TPA: hypothetical protein VF519_01795 [Mycobacteriales bacterium]